MTQTAIVKKIIDNGKKAEIQVQRETACGGNCGSCGGGCSFKNIITTTAINRASASVGDRVMVEASTKKIVGAAALIYLLPLLTFFIGYGITAAFNASEKVSILTSVFALFAGALVVIPVNKRFKSQVNFVITGVIS